MTVDAPPEAGYIGSAEPFGRGWSRARMWDQYAEGHRGVCLLFDREKLTHAVGESLRAQQAPLPYHRSVAYTPEGPAGSLLSVNPTEFAGNVTPQVVAEFIERHHDDLFFLTTTDWETEFEYRFVVTVADDEFVYADYGDALEAVIVGERLPAWQRASAVEACERVNVEALRLDWTLRRPVPATLDPLGPEPFDLYSALTEKRPPEDRPPPST